MYKFVNIYIVFFLVSGILPLVEVMLYQLFWIQRLPAISWTVALLPLILSFPIYLILGCMRNFPKRVVLPMALFMAWKHLFYALPVPFFLGFSNTNILLTLMHPCLGIVALVLLRYAGENGHWLYRRSDFEHVRFRWKRLCGFAAANVLLIIPLVGVYLAVSLSVGLSYLSHGFLHFGFEGISVEARTYLYQGKNIILLPTAHIAKADFYDKLVASLPAGNTVVIPEGVTDKNKLLEHGLNYEKLAGSLGLEAQDNQKIVADRHTKQCDVDISDFSWEIIDCLRSFSSASRYWSSGKRLRALQQFFSTPNPDPELFFRELLELRNLRVTECIADCLQAYDNIVIPWGAAHMPGIERAILAWDGIIAERRTILIWG